MTKPIAISFTHISRMKLKLKNKSMLVDTVMIIESGSDSKKYVSNASLILLAKIKNMTALSQTFRLINL